MCCIQWCKIKNPSQFYDGIASCESDRKLKSVCRKTRGRVWNRKCGTVYGRYSLWFYFFDILKNVSNMWSLHRNSADQKKGLGFPNKHFATQNSGCIYSRPACYSCTGNGMCLYNIAFFWDSSHFELSNHFVTAILNLSKILRKMTLCRSDNSYWKRIMPSVQY